MKHDDNEFRKIIKNIKQEQINDDFYVKINKRFNRVDENIRNLYLIHEGFLFKREHKNLNVCKPYIPTNLLCNFINLYHVRCGHCRVFNLY